VAESSDWDDDADDDAHIKTLVLYTGVKEDQRSDQPTTVPPLSHLSRSSSKDLIIQYIPQIEHNTSPLQTSIC
jgi:hypothetical protein